MEKDGVEDVVEDEKSNKDGIPFYTPSSTAKCKDDPSDTYSSTVKNEDDLSNIQSSPDDYLNLQPKYVQHKEDLSKQNQSHLQHKDDPSNLPPIHVEQDDDPSNLIYASGDDLKSPIAEGQTSGSGTSETQSLDSQVFVGPVGPEEITDRRSSQGSLSASRSKVLERQNSVEYPSIYSSNFSADSLNQDSSESSSSSSSTDRGKQTREGAYVANTESCENLLHSDPSYNSDTDTENQDTVKPADHRSRHRYKESKEGGEGLEEDGEEEEDSEYQDDECIQRRGSVSSYQRREDLDYEDNFLFDPGLDLEQLGSNTEQLCDSLQQLGGSPQQLYLRPDRLETVEEVSEPVSTSNSLLQDGLRFSSQNTSLTSTDIFSLTTEDPKQSLCSNTSKEEPFSVLEIEVRNDFQRKISDVSDHQPFSGVYDESSWDPRRPGELKEHSYRKDKGAVNREYTLFGTEREVFGQYVGRKISEASVNKLILSEDSIKELSSNQTGAHITGNTTSVHNDSQQDTPTSVHLDTPSSSESNHVNSPTSLLSNTSVRDEASQCELTVREQKTTSCTTTSSSSSSRVVETRSVLKEEHESYRSSSSSLSRSALSDIGSRREKESRLAQQLAEVKEGIYRLFSEDSDHSLEKNGNSIEEQLDYTELDSGLRADEDSSQSIDLDIRDKPEKDEWVTKELMGCVGRDKEERDPGTDSGIERVSSGGTTGWMARLGNRVRRGRIGSGGQSTASSSPDDRVDRPRSASTESPREGGFIAADRSNHGGLETRVRELWIRLAQMEAEKIKAVEQAVEEERSRVEQILNRERRELDGERERLDRRREEVDIRSRGLMEAQDRQVQLINSLQAKLVKYRGEAEDARRLVAELGGRSREDIEIIANLKADLADQQTRVNHQQILYKSEIQEWKVRVEEQQEKVKTVSGVNSILRQERDDLRQELELHRGLVHSLEAELVRSRQETERVYVARSRAGTNQSGELNHVLKCLTSLRREYSELKVGSVRELGRMKMELMNLSRLATNACIEVNSHASVIQDSRGRDVTVGTLPEVYAKYEKVRREKDQLEDKMENLEKSLLDSKKKIFNLERQAANEPPEKVEVRYAAGEDPERIVRLGKLEGENMILRCSLQDIASMLEGGLDWPTPASPRSRPRPVTPARVVARRTRSASPSLAPETTVAAVQSVLNRKQLEAHELQTRLNTLTDKLKQVTRSEASWEARIKELDQELSTARQEVETLQRGAEENKVELDELTKKLKMVRTENEDFYTRWKDTKEELATAQTSNQDLERSNTKLGKKAEIFSAENGKMEQRVVELVEQLRDSGLLISQLERVGSSLREEALELRERLAAVERDQERLERERNETETFITEEKMNSTTVTSQVQKMEREEKILRERILIQENTEQKLKTEVSMSEVVISGLREQILEYETRIHMLETDLGDLRRRLEDKDGSLESLEAELRTVKGEKTKLENHVTSLNLRKDALEDMNNHLQEEIRQLKVHEEELSLTSGALNERRETLEERLLQKEKELDQLRDRLTRSESEMEREIAAGDELRAELEEEELRRKDLLEEMNEKNLSLQQLNQQNLQLKAQYLEAANQLNRMKDEAETEMENERKRLERKIRKLEDENSDLKEELEQELNLIRKEVESKKDKKIKEMEVQLKTEQIKHEDELDYCNQVIDNLRSRNKESLFMAENSRNTAEKMTEKEESMAEERIEELLAKVEELGARLSQERKEHVLLLEKEKSNSSQGKLEIKKLKTKLDETLLAGKQEKNALIEEMKKIKADKERSDSQLFELRERVAEYERQIENLRSELKVSEDLLRENEREQTRRKKEIEELEMKLVDKNKKIQEKIKEKHREVESLERKVEIMEKSESLLKEELVEVRETVEITKQTYSSSSLETSRLEGQVRELTGELEVLRASLAADTARHSDAKRLTEVQKRYEDLSYEKKKLDHEYRELRRRMDEDTERYKIQIQSLHDRLDESSEREKGMETLRHSLENQLASRGQEYGQLVMRLRGAEGRLREMTENMARLEASKGEYESKLAQVNSALQLRSRGNTPTRHSRSRFRSGDSYRQQDEVDFVRTNLKDLSSRSDKADRERSELLAKVDMLKRSNDEFARTVSRLEEEKFLLEQKLNSTQVQLAKLEKKVLTSDEILAEREESIELLKSQTKTFERKIRELSTDLESAKDDLKRAEDRLRDTGDRSRKYKAELGKLTETIAESEDTLGRMEVLKNQLETENERLRDLLADKETSFKGAQGKAERLREEVAGLETHCSRLTAQLNKTQDDLDRCSRAEREMAIQVESLQHELSAGAREFGGAAAEADQLRRRNTELEQEVRLIEDRMENSKTVAESVKKKGREAEDRMAELSRRLVEAERGWKESEERLAKAGTNTGADNYLKDELNKARKVNQVLVQEKTELERKVKIMKTEIKESRFSNFESDRVVRTQIPLMSGKQVAGKECGDHIVRIRILEHEAEGYIRRIKSLEQNINEIERKTQERVEQLLNEKRVERERDHSRHTQEIKHLEHSLNTRERMYKERISGLEDQLNLLREQFSHEARSRRSFIASSKAISADVSGLRRQLDQSLEAVNSSMLDSNLLERETSRLQDTLGRYDLSKMSPARFEPSRVRSSVIRTTTGSLDNLDQVATSTPLRLDPAAKFRPELRSSLDPRSSGYSRRSSGLRRNLNSEYDVVNLTK